MTKMFEMEVNDHVERVMRSIRDSFEKQIGTNCVLRCEGKEIKCHKFMLTAFSSYFDTLNDNESMFITNIKYKHLLIFLKAIYYGIVNIPVNELPVLIRKAEKLGLENLFTGLPSGYAGSHHTKHGEHRHRHRLSAGEDNIVEANNNNNNNADEDDEDECVVNVNIDNEINDDEENGDDDGEQKLSNSLPRINHASNDIRNNNGHNYDRKDRPEVQPVFIKRKSNENWPSRNGQHHILTSDWKNGKHCNYVIKTSNQRSLVLNKSASISSLSSRKSSSTMNGDQRQSTRASVENSSNYVTVTRSKEEGESSESEHEIDIEKAKSGTLKYLKGELGGRLTTTAGNLERQLKDGSGSDEEKKSYDNPSRNGATIFSNSNTLTNVSNGPQQQQTQQHKQSINNQVVNGAKEEPPKVSQQSLSSGVSREDAKKVTSNIPSIITTTMSTKTSSHPVAISYHPINRNLDGEEEIIEEEDDDDEDEEMIVATASTGDDDNWDDFRIDDENDWQIMEMSRHNNNISNGNGNDTIGVMNADYANTESNDEWLNRKRKRTRDPQNFKNRFPCPECGKILANFYYKEEHVRVKHQKLNLICTESGCNFEVLERDKFNEHLKRVHGKEIKRGRPRSDASY